MQISKEDYFFFEWLIVGKGMTEETFAKLSPVQVEALRTEWKKDMGGNDLTQSV